MNDRPRYYAVRYRLYPAYTDKERTDYRVPAYSAADAVTQIQVREKELECILWVMPAEPVHEGDE